MILFPVSIFSDIDSDFSISYEGEKITEDNETVWEQNFQSDLYFSFDLGYVMSFNLGNEYEENTEYKVNETSISLDWMPGFSHFIILTFLYEDSTDLDGDGDDDYTENGYQLFYNLDLYKNHEIGLSFDENIRDYSNPTDFTNDYTEIFSYLEYEWDITKNIELSIKTDYNVNHSTEVYDTYETKVYGMELYFKLGDVRLAPEFSYEKSEYETDNNYDDYLQRNYELEFEFSRANYFFNFELEPSYESKRYRVNDSIYLDYNEFSYELETIFLFRHFYEIHLEYEFEKRNYIDYNEKDQFDATEENYYNTTIGFEFVIDNKKNFELEIGYEQETEINNDINSDEDYKVDEFYLNLEYNPTLWLYFEMDTQSRNKKYKTVTDQIFSNYIYYDVDCSVTFRISKKFDIELKFEFEKEDYEVMVENNEVNKTYGITMDYNF